MIDSDVFTAEAWELCSFPIDVTSFAPRARIYIPWISSALLLHSNAIESRSRSEAATVPTASRSLIRRPHSAVNFPDKPDGGLLSVAGGGGGASAAVRRSFRCVPVAFFCAAGFGGLPLGIAPTNYWRFSPICKRNTTVAVYHLRLSFFGRGYGFAAPSLYPPGFLCWSNARIMTVGCPGQKRVPDLRDAVRCGLLLLRVLRIERNKGFASGTRHGFASTLDHATPRHSQRIGDADPILRLSALFLSGPLPLAGAHERGNTFPGQLLLPSNPGTGTSFASLIPPVVSQ